ncbi:glucose/galactose MFS transporter [Marinilabilia rubra]|uniref:Glucose/galactose MFS transporter n=1 Tax=Marinilabilia rubra TaxID=2162893 RepID=A0A2U2BAW1_9BACT|nr:glucose/galactose MFS transporter [Marinilabilia rubra]PWE00201.1 glucose/galactose MFS transporter [Marinilabilia rubra]
MAKNKYLFPLIIMAALFFLIGFMTTMNNSMIDFLKEAFGLDNRPNGQILKQLPNTFFFGAYALSVPVGLMIHRIGYKNGVTTGVGLLALGIVLCIPLVALGYIPFLFGVAVFAIGIVFLQVAANPYVNALGPAKTAASRLTLTNFLNSVATVIAPMFVSMLIISDGADASEMAPTQVQEPFMIIGGIAVVIFVVMFFLKLPQIKGDEHDDAEVPKEYKSSAFKYTHVWLGSLAIFFYMGIEIGIPSFFADYTKQLGLDFSSAQRTDMLKYYWGGLMVGRLLGIFILQKYTARQILTLCSVGGIVLVASSFAVGSSNAPLAMWLLLGTGLAHSIMWPTIYNLALEDLGPHAGVASGVISSAVIGAAILTPMMGAIQALTGSVVFAISCLFVYYLYLVFFATKGSKIR